MITCLMSLNEIPFHESNYFFEYAMFNKIRGINILLKACQTETS